MNLSIQEILTQAGAFVLLVFVLKKFAWKPILELLDARREKIRLDLEQAEQSRNEVEKIKAGYEASRAAIEEEARKKVQDAVDQGKTVAREIQDQARNEARALLEKAKEDIGIEVAKAKISLRNEIADLTLHTTERLLGEKLSDKKDKELVLQFIDKMGETKS